MRWGCGCGSFRAGVRVISGFSRLLRAAVWPPGDAGAQRSLSPGPAGTSGERRNAENLSETVPGSARGMQRFLTDSPWDDEVIIGRLQEYLGTRLEQPEGVWVLDGSDFPKQGRKSVGVARQYCGRLGKVANCQAGILAYVSPLGRALVDKGLYCPRVGPRTKTGVRRRVCRRIAGLPVQDGVGLGEQERGHLKAGWVGGGRRLRDAVLPGGPGGLGDVVRAGRSVRLYGVAAGACLDQCGVSGIRASPQTQAARRSAPDHGAAQRRVAGGGLA